MTSTEQVTEQRQFAQNDTVVWNPAMLNETAHPRMRHGEGPFTVVSTESVPVGCSYPESHCASGTHSRQCNVSTRQSVGHPQWVIIRPTEDATSPEGAAGELHLSGAWLVHA